MSPLAFIADLRWADIPAPVRNQVELCLLDLLGVGLAAADTRLAKLVAAHAASQFGGAQALLFDGRPASAAGVALAGGMTIDALDGHDGYNPAKGHVGCGLLPGALALARVAGTTRGEDFLSTIAMGYEIGSRLGPILHATVPDYHTSGAWIAVAVAATGARLLQMSPGATRHALGIAEYHGPRSQMMRCIDHPTMVKDGSGWGAMAGVSAALLARDGFTGAPALTIEADPAPWADLGRRWLICEQYFKPYPVCRWAQSPIEAILHLRRAHDLAAGDVAAIEVETFHEATRLATKAPKTTEEAQYSTSFPSAVALVRGGVAAADICDGALDDPDIRRLSHAMTMTEHETANAAFPDTRLARVTLRLTDGTTLKSGWVSPRWGPEAPPTETELRLKYHDLADRAVGVERAERIETALSRLTLDGLGPLDALLSQPISDRTIPPSSS